MIIKDFFLIELICCFSPLMIGRKTSCRDQSRKKEKECVFRSKHRDEYIERKRRTDMIDIDKYNIERTRDH